MNSQGAVECELTKHEWTDHSRSVDVQVKQVWVSTGFRFTAPGKASLLLTEAL